MELAKDPFRESLRRFYESFLASSTFSECSAYCSSILLKKNLIFCSRSSSSLSFSSSRWPSEMRPRLTPLHSSLASTEEVPSSSIRREFLADWDELLEEELSMMQKLAPLSSLLRAEEVVLLLSAQRFSALMTCRRVLSLACPLWDILSSEVLLSVLS